MEKSYENTGRVARWFMCQQLVSEMELINILIMIITFNISLYFPRLFP